MGLGRIWDTQITPNLIEFKIEFTSNQTDSVYRYRGRVKVFYGSGDAYAYTYTTADEYVRGSTPQTFILPIVKTGPFNWVPQRGTTYTCEVVVEYYNEDAPQYGWRESTTARHTFQLYIPTCNITASVQSVTENSATIKVGFETDCYNGDIYYTAFYAVL